jgi:hypothetical protein
VHIYRCVIKVSYFVRSQNRNQKQHTITYDKICDESPRSHHSVSLPAALSTSSTTTGCRSEKNNIKFTMLLRTDVGTNIYTLTNSTNTQYITLHSLSVNYIFNDGQIKQQESTVMATSATFLQLQTHIKYNKIQDHLRSNFIHHF